ncbi:MAG TPA: hypothetical protein ENN45_01890, partial [Bacteroidetes bacterium]|nr:hypothetical protein [Bacteroidota bacterium]
MSNRNNSAARYFENLSVQTKDLIVAETDAEFDKAFDNWLEVAISRLESSSKEFKDLGEDAISSILAGYLSTGEVSVTRETHSNGHVDLTVKLVNSPTNRTKLGEAKIWSGPSYHTKGLGQLLNRYTTGRECRGFVISYVKLQDIKALFEKLRQYIDNEKSCNLQGICKDHNIR